MFDIFLFIILFFDFAFLNFTAICFIAYIIKINKMKGELSYVDLSSNSFK